MVNATVRDRNRLSIAEIRPADMQGRLLMISLVTAFRENVVTWLAEEAAP